MTTLPPTPVPEGDRPHVVAPAYRDPTGGAYRRDCSCDAVAWGWTKDAATEAARGHLDAGAAHAEAVGAMASRAQGRLVRGSAGVPAREPARAADSLSGPRGGVG